MDQVGVTVLVTVNVGDWEMEIVIVGVKVRDITFVLVYVGDTELVGVIVGV